MHAQRIRNRREEYRCTTCGRVFASSHDLNTHAQSCAAEQSRDIREKIRDRAYEIYLQRGAKPGSAEQDWLEAEKEILGSRARAA